MTKQVIDLTERLNRLYDSHEDTVTQVFYEKINDEDNSPDEIARGIIDAFNNCESAHDFELINSVIVAISGWNVDSLLEIVEDRVKYGKKVKIYAEWIDYMSAYRLFSPSNPSETIAYEENLEDLQEYDITLCDFRGN